MTRRVKCEDHVKRGERIVMLSVRGGVTRARLSQEAFVKGKAKRAPMGTESTAMPMEYEGQR